MDEATTWRSETLQIGLRRIAPSIKADSPFAPKQWRCSLCDGRNGLESAACKGSGCCGLFGPSQLLFDHEGNAVSAARFPVHWLCSICGVIHSVLDILNQCVSCPCGHPNLQAVYDQFGDLFLFWRDDPAVRDLRDPCQVQEAARRLWDAGSAPWLREMSRDDEVPGECGDMLRELE